MILATLSTAMYHKEIQREELFTLLIHPNKEKDNKKYRKEFDSKHNTLRNLFKYI